jgi:hypothetical protein
MHFQLIKIASNLKLDSLLVTNPPNLLNIFMEMALHMGIALNIELN